jgi:hypothetical protein
MLFPSTFLFYSENTIKSSFYLEIPHPILLPISQRSQNDMPAKINTYKCTKKKQLPNSMQNKCLNTCGRKMTRKEKKRHPLARRRKIMRKRKNDVSGGGPCDGCVSGAGLMVKNRSLGSLLARALTSKAQADGVIPRAS